jgi:hypothetical protein
MKNLKIILFVSLTCLLEITNLHAQTAVQFNNTFYSDTTINLTERYQGMCNGFVFSGQVQLLDKDAIVRLIARDDDGNSYLLYENYPLIAEETSELLFEKGEETRILPDRTRLENLDLIIRNAVISVDDVKFLNEKRSNFELAYETNIRNICQEKVSIINQNLVEKGLLWRAKVSDYSLIPFRLKAIHFGGEDYMADGYEYYGGGVFSVYNNGGREVVDSIGDKYDNTNPFVSTSAFDWREAHNANQQSSGYFDNNPDSDETGNGWLTSSKNQVDWASPGSSSFLYPNTRVCSNGCFLFGPLSAIEAAMNLYYNNHLDYDLSEQWVMERGYNDVNDNYICGTCLDKYINIVEPIGTMTAGDSSYYCDTIYFNNAFHVADSILLICDSFGAPSVPLIHTINITDVDYINNEKYIYHSDVFVINPGVVLHQNKILSPNYLSGGYVSRVFDTISSYGVVNETHLPWQDTILFGNTSSFIEDPISYRVYADASSTANLNTVKYKLLKYGPAAGKPTSGHICTLVGFGRISPGDTIGTDTGWGDSIIVSMFHPKVGKDFWIFKEQKGPDWGDGGYLKIETEGQNNVPHSYFIEEKPIETLSTHNIPVYDKDGDGYCFWGLGPKPVGCDTCPDEPDCNDDDPIFHTYDESMRCMPDCDIIANLPDLIPETIEHDTTIYDCFLKRNLVIDGNACVTLRGNMFIGENVKITVKHGSTLYLSGAHLMGYCGKKWDGIYVEGNRDSSLGETGNAMLMSSGAIVEDANVAVNGDVGAVMELFGTEFRRNYTDVYLKPKVLTPYSLQVNNFTSCDFVNCKFSTYDTVVNQQPNVALICVKGIDFNNCVFKDFRDKSFNEQNKRGIMAMSAGFKVKNTDSNLINFEGLEYGIASDYSNFLPIKIEGAYFDGCQKSIYMSGAFNLDIFSDTIQVSVSDTITHTATNYSYGIYLDECTGYQVENCAISAKKTIYFDPHLYFAGIVVNNSGEMDNEIYRNHFQRNNNAIQAIGCNKDTVEQNGGLVFRCNKFDINTYDLFITPDLENPESTMLNSGIAPFQGNLSEPAGNIFSDSTNRVFSGYTLYWGDYMNIQNDTEFFTYFHHDTIDNNRLRPDKIIGDLTLYNTENADFLNACPDMTTDTSGGSAVGELDPIKTKIAQYDNQLTTLTDGGNTELTVAEIVLANDNTAWQTYLELMDKSPYLSEEALKEVAKKEDVLSAPMVRDVLVSNPQAAKSSEIQKVLDERIVQLPNYMLEQIQSGMTNISPKEYLELRKTEEERKLQKIIQRKLSIFTKDTILQHDSIAYYLSLQDNIPGHKNLAAYYASILDYESAINEINQIVVSNAQMQSELQEISSFYNLLNTISNDTLEMNNLTDDYIHQLFFYENSSSHIAAHTRALLKLNSACNYVEPIYMPLQTKRVNIKSNNAEISTELFQVFPNPASDYVNFYWKLNHIAESSLQIFNNQGVLLYSGSVYSKENSKVVPVISFASGVYTAIIKTNDRIVKSVKFTVK